MINIKDIQIGNWICTDENHWGTVESITNTVIVKHALITRNYNPEQLFPIKVTLHILSLCGFEIFNTGYRHKESYQLLRYFGEGDFFLDIAGKSVKLSYVHQLQNLYFKITGKLLEPNLYGN